MHVGSSMQLYGHSAADAVAGGVGPGWGHFPLFRGHDTIQLAVMIVQEITELQKLERTSRHH